MEKFQKYCLSVLLVIIYNNISAHVKNGTVESDDCKRLWEVYSQFLSSQDCSESVIFLAEAKADHYCSLNQKQKAVDAIGAKSPQAQSHISFYKDSLGLFFIGNAQHNKYLKNFQQQSKGYDFAEYIYFKSKVSKIRNKDYLDLRS